MKENATRKNPGKHGDFPHIETYKQLAPGGAIGAKRHGGVILLRARTKGKMFNSGQGSDERGAGGGGNERGESVNKRGSTAERKSRGRSDMNVLA